MNNEETGIVNETTDITANTQQTTSISKEDLERVLKEFFDTKEEIEKKNQELKEQQKELIKTNIDTNMAIKEANSMSYVSIALIALIVGILLGSLFWRHTFKSI